MASQPSKTELRGESAWKNRDELTMIVRSPLMWGAVLTVGFYHLIPYLPWQQELAQRYFTGHPLAYVEAALFFLGLAILCIKGISLAAQNRALQLDLLADTTLRAPGDAVDKARQVLETLRSIPSRLKETFLVRRVAEVCSYVRDLGCNENLYEHQKYLADIGSDRLHDSYALIRTITWAVPILGFLGTVVGITIAIANVQPEQLQESMDEVTGGLGIAFDTTTLALALTLVLVFLSHWVERCEQQILNRVDELSFNCIGAWFPESNHAKSPLQKAESQAAENLLRQTETLVTWQTQLWQQGIEDLRRRWLQTLDEQQRQFSTALGEGMDATLSDHSRQLSQIRGELLEGFRTVSQEMAAMMAEHRQSIIQQQETANRQLGEYHRQAQTEMLNMHDELRLQTEQVTQSMASSAQLWQSEVKSASEAMTSHLGELRHQSEVLARVVEQEENLARLQTRLAENLEAIRSVEAFDETLHNLSAAVHLLTIRSKAKAA